MKEENTYMIFDLNKSLMSEYPVIVASTGANAIRKYLGKTHSVKRSGSKYAQYSVTKVILRDGCFFKPHKSKTIWYEDSI